PDEGRGGHCAGAGRGEGEINHVERDRGGVETEVRTGRQAAGRDRLRAGEMADCDKKKTGAKGTVQRSKHWKPPEQQTDIGRQRAPLNSQWLFLPDSCRSAPPPGAISRRLPRPG